jgi:hypothetical protein
MLAHSRRPSHESPPFAVRVISLVNKASDTSDSRKALAEDRTGDALIVVLLFFVLQLLSALYLLIGRNL